MKSRGREDKGKEREGGQKGGREGGEGERDQPQILCDQVHTETSHGCESIAGVE